MKYALGGLLGILFMTLVGVQATCGAVALQIQPLQYHTTLKVGEKQRGFIDVGNPTTQKVTVDFSVQAFRQIDDKGDLQFYDNAQIQAGIRLDLTSTSLDPGEAVRMYFVADGSMLPSGDVFAAIFATAEPPAQTAGMSQTVRVGTLLSIVNGTPGGRDAAIEQVAVGFWQFDPAIHGSYRIRNTAAQGVTTGFYPEVTIALDPFHTTQTATGSLIMAGRTRQNDFQLSTERFGLYRLTVRYGTSERSHWVLIISGRWWWLAIGLVAAVVASGLLLWRRRRKIAFRLRKQ